MRSALTRHVFRQILLNEPLVHSRCSRSFRRSTARSFSSTTARPFLNFDFGRPKQRRELKAENIDPGYREMTQLTGALSLKVRPASRDAILQAFEAFIKSRSRRKGATTDLQIEHALTTFKHLQSTNCGHSGVPNEALEQALRVVANKSHSGADLKRLELGKLLWDELRPQADNAVESPELSGEQSNLQNFLRVVSTSGQPHDSLAFILGHLEANPALNEDPAVFRVALKAAARTDDETQVERVLHLMKQHGHPFTDHERSVIIRVFINADNLAAVKRWYVEPLTASSDGHRVDKFGSNDLSPKIAPLVFDMCLSKNELEFAGSIVNSILEQADSGAFPSPRDWRLIFAWAAANKQSIEDIQRMITVMKQRARAANIRFLLNASTINALLKVATSRNDIYSAERYLALGKSLAIKPDAETHLIMLNHRLKNNDIDGARQSYRDLSKVEIPDQEDVEAANKLILALCRQQMDVEIIMDVVTDLIDRNAHFDPEVVLALCMLHMKRDELHDAIDLVRTHAFQFTAQQRAMLRDGILEFCLASTTPADPTWDSYVMLHELFEAETSRDTRQTIMMKLFEQERPDMAIHVFGHMRQNPHFDRRPTAESYMLCLEGLARSGGDSEHLRTVHNMLKLDQVVDPETRLSNALMLGHLAAGSSASALREWESILASQEGPNYASFRIALMASERYREGERVTRNIWDKLYLLPIDIDADMYSSYAWALASHKLLDEALDMILQMDTKYGRKPTAITLAVMSNVCPDFETKALLWKWASENFPELWEQVQSLPTRTVGRIVQYEEFRVDRGVRA